MKLYKATPEGQFEFTPEEYAEWEKDQAALVISNQVQFAANARAERNCLLSETDWTQVADVPQTTKDKWAAYRQALRDVPQQTGFPDNIQWPSKPE
jgi:hypothetical protein